MLCGYLRQTSYDAVTNKMNCLFLYIMFLSVIRLQAAPDWQLIDPAYPIKDVLVSAYDVSDYGAAGDGVTDVTGIFQALLDSCDKIGGGVVFVPEGRYVIRGRLEIPKGITIRGEWKKPVKGEPVEGTILMAYAGQGDESADPFITMLPSSAVRDLIIWYPEQNPDNITQYPPTIIMGKPDYFGNEFCNVKNVTLVNAYTGVQFSRETGGGCPIVNGLYGTPLSRGVEIDNIADVGRLDWIDFSPDYWSGSGLEGAPAAGSSFESWIYQNGTGIVMRRNDWSYGCFISVEGYRRGYLTAESVTSPGSTPNGHHYDLEFTGCKTALEIAATNNVGIMFTGLSAKDCETGIAVGPGTSGAVQIQGSSIDADGPAVDIDASSTTRFLMQQCVVSSGEVSAEGGTLVARDCDFNNGQPQISLGSSARCCLTGNRFDLGTQIESNSNYECVIDHTPVSSERVPEIPVIEDEKYSADRSVLYVATEAPFNAVNDGVTDNTDAIQSALDRASADGGGIVFLPPGKYKVLGNLTVPSGVELCGSVNNSTTPTGPGSILEVYAGRNSPSSTPFLRLSAGSGVRGMIFNYPEQISTQLPDIASYPYLIQVTGSDAYIINVGMRAAYKGIDLFTYKCDNHYVDWIAGHVFKTGIRVGGGSAGGTIKNTQFNVIVYACGSESKFGSWPNSPSGGNPAVYDYAFDSLDFMILENCSDELLYNDFHYGSHRGIVLRSENGTGPSGISLGLGLDGCRRSMCLEATGTGGFDFINSQVVSIGGETDFDYIETGPEAECTFFSSDYWGRPGYSLRMNGGTLNFQLANFHQHGTQGFALVNDGSLNIESSAIWPVSPLLNSGAESRLSAQASIIDPSGIDEQDCGLWKNNLSNNIDATRSAPLNDRDAGGKVGLTGVKELPGRSSISIDYSLKANFRDITKVVFSMYDMRGRCINRMSLREGLGMGANQAVLKNKNIKAYGLYMITMDLVFKNDTENKSFNKRFFVLR